MIRRRDQASSSPSSSNNNNSKNHRIVSNNTSTNNNNNSTTTTRTNTTTTTTTSSDNNNNNKINEKTKYELSTLLHQHCTGSTRCTKKGTKASTSAPSTLVSASVSTSDSSYYIEDAIIQKFKSILKQQEAYIEIAYHQLIKSILTKKNSTTRYHALTFIHEGMRSRTFRQLLAQDFREFIKLTVEGTPADPKTDSTTAVVGVSSSSGKNSAFLSRKNSKYGSQLSLPNVLPPPEKSAMKLRAKALELIENWSETYGQLYPAFRKGYEYIENKLKFQFPRLREHYLNQVQLQGERQRHRQVILLSKFKHIKEMDYVEKMIHVEVCLRQLEVCLEQIIPSFEEMMKIAIRQDEEESAAVAVSALAVTSTTTTSNSEEEQYVPFTTTTGAEENDYTFVDFESLPDNNTHSQFNQFEEDESNDELNVTTTTTNDFNMENYELQNEEEENEEEWEEVTAAAVAGGDDKSYDFGGNIDDMMKDVGIFSNDYEITINLKDIFQDQETIDNTTLFEICKENLKTLKTIYYPLVKEWMRIMTAVELNNQSDISERQTMLLKCIDMKNKMTMVFDKCEKLKIENYELSIEKTKLMEKQIETARKMEEEIIEDLILKRKRSAISGSSSSRQDSSKKKQKMK